MESDFNTNTEHLLVKEVIASLSKWGEDLGVFTYDTTRSERFTSGKMLHTRLAARLMKSFYNDQYFSQLKYACIATEIVHTANLFHFDLNDGASIYRSIPALWRTVTPDSSILMGDLFMSEAVMFIIKTGNINDVKIFIRRVLQVCRAEIEQELILRGDEASFQQYVNITRLKSGPLFAFTASMCSDNDLKLRKALEEVGYLIGTAYRIADDLVDEYECEDKYEKTLRADRLCQKFVSTQPNARETLHDYIDQLCYTALDILQEWPEKYSSLKSFLEQGFKQYLKVA